MDLDFSTVHQEVLLDNIVTIIKQNFLFQTQINILEKKLSVSEEEKIHLKEYVKETQNLKDNLSDYNFHKERSDQLDNIINEKNRVQTAFNETLANIKNTENKFEEDLKIITEKLEEKNKNINTKFSNEIDILNTKIKNLNKEKLNLIAYIKDIESLCAPAKLKKYKETYKENI